MCVLYVVLEQRSAAVTVVESGLEQPSSHNPHLKPQSSSQATIPISSHHPHLKQQSHLKPQSPFQATIPISTRPMLNPWLVLGNCPELVEREVIDPSRAYLQGHGS